MRVAPLAGRVEDAVRDALLSSGWEGDLARTAADGLESLAFRLTGMDDAALQALVRTGQGLGLDVVTGDGWAVVSGSRARLSALARPGTVPGALAELASVLGQALPAEDPLRWQTARGPCSVEAPVIVGVLNLTPDSFSDGGRYADVEAALRQAERLLAEGAAILDVGGESTRPGARPVEEAEERRRVLPVIEALAVRFNSALISVDTVKSGVASAALDAGAAIVNDVSGLRLDPALGALCAERGAGLILMHSRGAVGDLASLDHAEYPGGVVSDVAAELALAVGRAQEAGIQSECIVVDPGLGFGKTPDQNVELLKGLGGLRVLGRPIMVGPSRKRFLGALTARPIEERDGATATACALAWEAGARLFRVHEPAATRDALAVARAIRPR